MNFDDSAEVATVRRAWAAIARGDLSVLEGALAPDARWRAVQDGPWNCESRREIIEVMERNLANGLKGTVEEMIQEGTRVLVAFRPAQPRQAQRPLDDGIAYVVVSFRDGRLVEMKGCATRASGLDYLRGASAESA